MSFTSEILRTGDYMLRSFEIQEEIRGNLCMVEGDRVTAVAVVPPQPTITKAINGIAISIIDNFVFILAGAPFMMRF